MATRTMPFGLAVEPTHRNLTPAELYEHALRRQEGILAEAGPLCVVTTPFTGRSPQDKFIVRDGTTSARIWWGPNQPLAPEPYARLRDTVVRHLAGQPLYAADVLGGADPRYRVPMRVVTPSAWHALFAHNMFRRPQPEDRLPALPAWDLLHAPELHADPPDHGTRSGTFIVLHFGERVILLGGTRYAGELKKAVFTVLNYLLPERDVLPMHCAANVGPGGDVALFFGLSGTGKTTLSADPGRALIGDDEHGWSGEGVFNFEGGCYAKVIRLSGDGEPAIYATTRRFGTVLENVVVDPNTRAVDLDSAAITENTRASYPIHFIPNHVATGVAGHPSHVVLLTCDAYGVMPPVARLSPAQAMYHFLSGYTAKVAGTERGIGEPKATFSTCFAAPFLPLPPDVYSRLLGAKLARHGARCWLVNTGWTGGPYGQGQRIALEITRAIVRAALAGALEDSAVIREPVFGLEVPQQVPGVPEQVLLPRATWTDPAAYDAQAARVAGLFRRNFEQFATQAGDAVRDAGPPP